MESSKVIRLNEISYEMGDLYSHIHKLETEAAKIIQSVEPTPETFQELWTAFTFFQDADLELMEFEYQGQRTVEIHTNTRDDDKFDEVLMVKILKGVYQDLEYTGYDGASTQGSVYIYKYTNKLKKILLSKN